MPLRVRSRRRPRIVRHHHNSLAKLFVERLHQVQNFLGALGIEVAGFSVVGTPVVNLVEASSRRLQASMLRDNDPRVSEIKSLLDALANARADEHWETAERSAEQLVTWTTELAEQHEARGDDDRDG